jgi:hypothetical protein
VAAKNPKTELARHLLWLWDGIRGPLATIQDRDMEAAEAARRELSVIFECLVDEARTVQAQSRARKRSALYGPEASGRFLACLGIPEGHRAWKRLDSVEERAHEQTAPGEIRVTLE